MGLFGKLKASLTKTKEVLSSKIENALKVFRKVDEELFEELEEILIMGDLGVRATMDILDDLKEKVKKNLSTKYTLEALTSRVYK